MTSARAVTRKLLGTRPGELPPTIPASSEVASKFPQSCPKVASKLILVPPRSGLKFGGFRPAWASCLANLCHSWPNLSSTNFGRFSPVCSTVWSRWAKLGLKARPKSANVGRTWSDFGQSWRTLGGDGPNLPNVAEFGQEIQAPEQRFRNFGHIWGQLWSSPGSPHACAFRRSSSNLLCSARIGLCRATVI